MTEKVQADVSDDLTDEQRAALAPQIRLIEAGPGAGKTKTIVARLRNEAAAGRSVALLSFTNAAVDVARARCRDVPELIQPPNFIGTFDTFFHRYVLTPATRRALGRSPTYLSSWDDLPRHGAIVRPPSGGPGIRLSRFVRSPDGWWRPDLKRLNRNEESAWTEPTEWTRDRFVEIATRRINSLHAALIFDAEEARRRAFHVLTDDDQPFLARLKRRFYQVLVDEFQDCDHVEHSLLARLHQHGIHVVAVADPDQAIYEFRQSSTGLYEQFREKIKSDEIAHLTTCFRSTPAICSLVTSLRSVGRSDVVAGGSRWEDKTVIHVVVGSGRKAGTKALEIAREHDIPGGRTRVVAHRRSDARALTRAGNQPPKGTSRMEPVLAALSDLRSDTDVTGRASAVRIIESFVLDQFDFSQLVYGEQSVEVIRREDQLDHLGLSPLRLRSTVTELMRASEAWSTGKECSASVRAIVEDLADGLSVPLTTGIGQRLRVMPAVWNFWTSRTSTLEVNVSGERVRWGHVHGVKGHEFEAVILAIPPTRPSEPGHVLDDWQNGTNTERRRVLYVGASRAERLLVLVVPRAHSQKLQNLLVAREIAFELTVA